MPDTLAGPDSRGYCAFRGQLHDRSLADLRRSGRRGACPLTRVIDRRDIWPLMSSEHGGLSPQPAFLCHNEAVRSGSWKL